MPPRSTLWPLENHTRGKHLVLKNYMGAWLPIMRRHNGRVLFIDAFAGPGEYTGREPGSPVIALRALINHNARMIGEIRYIFIEKDAGRYEHLKTVLANLEPEMPDNCKYQVINSTFDETLTETLDRIDDQKQRLAPSFVMIDPFGVSDTPMNTVGRILSNPKSEVYVSFMSRDINRFREHANFERHLDDLFGCRDWREGIDLPEGKERIAFFYDLYKSQLKAAGAKYVLHFELYEGNELVYAIFFGTGKLEGCDKMKQAIWKIAPFGDYRFRGSKIDQLTFLSDEIIDFTILAKTLHDEFKSKGWVKINEVIDFVRSDATDFHSNHLKSNTLRPMEERGEIEVDLDSRKRKGRYPEGTMLRFVNSRQELQVHQGRLLL